MTSRISPQMKKRLQASLETLTAKEAGRLFAIYAMEADKKDKDVVEYQPAKELRQAMEARVAKSRGKPTEAQAVNRFNGFVLLNHLWGVVNHSDGPAILLAFSSDTFRVMTAIIVLLQEDATVEMIRRIRATYAEGPSPVTVDDYNRLIRWGETEELYSISEAANVIFEALDDRSPEEREAAFAAIRAKTQARLDAGEITLDDLAKELQEGDDDPEFDAIVDDLVARLKAGELEGGEGFYVDDIGSPVLIEDGTMPAWVALRLTWRPYVRSRGLGIFDYADVAEWAPTFVDRIGRRDGKPVDDKELHKLAADFYKECRRRPWGKGLVAKPDVDDLVKLLTQSPNPFLHVKPFDFGRADWEAFSKVETDSNSEPYTSEPVATYASLGRLDDQVKAGADFGFGVGYRREKFYPVASLIWSKGERARIFAMMTRLDTTRQPFSYDRIEEGLMPMSDLMGMKFLTPLENQVENLRRVADQVASLKAALQTISDRYFGGLPILQKDPRELLDQIEDNVATAKRVLSQWVESLPRWPWEVDTSDLEVGEPEVDEDFAEDLVATFVNTARRLSRVMEPEDKLFDEGGRQ